MQVQGQDWYFDSVLLMFEINCNNDMDDCLLKVLLLMYGEKLFDLKEYGMVVLLGFIVILDCKFGIDSYCGFGGVEWSNYYVLFGGVLVNLFVEGCFDYYQIDNFFIGVLDEILCGVVSIGFRIFYFLF